jgi:anti-anti-sigma factor
VRSHTRRAAQVARWFTFAGAFANAHLPAPAGAARLRLTGELDLVTADHARAAIRATQDESRVLICDLGGVGFVDVAGLRVLLDAAAHAERTGRRLIVANSPTILPRMLRLLELEHALEVPAAPLRTSPDQRCVEFRRHVS